MKILLIENEKMIIAYVINYNEHDINQNDFISGINAMSAPPAIADSKAIHPAYLPITSSTIILWCVSPVVCNLSSASAATDTAVLYPNVISVHATSLSIVFGTPITFIPFK